MGTEFYNHEQKERYFSERETSYRMIRSIGRTFFNITKEYEERLAKDCSNFTVNEILNMYASCSTRSWEQLLNFNSQLKIYTSWCIKEGLVADNQNHYEELDKRDMYNCLNIGLKESMILTRKELEKGINKMLNPSEQFLALAFFEGFGGARYKDFYELSMDQFKGNVVDLGNRKLTVSPLLVAKAEESAEEYIKYNEDGPLRAGYRTTDPSVIKDSSNAYTDTEMKNVRRIQRRITAMENKYGKAYGYVGLRNSGRIHMIKEFMKQDKCDDVRTTYDTHKSEIEKRYGKLQRIYRWVDEYAVFFEDSGR